MKNLECLVYISRCTLDQAALEAQLEDLVAVSAFRNKSAQITGVLVHENGYFFQMLEGAPAALDLLMIHLHFDERHEDIRVVAREKIPTKNAVSWAMVTPPLDHPLRRDLRTLASNPPSSVQPWRRLLLEMIPENA
ncbi:MULTISPECIES: BLUF domain-containing protein [Brevundimonas]|uniref:BLUF domain-containing protein n=1 Tax=Brevundimonas pishanensis TaxID=2896315 RepID=UPI001FA6E50F|nr:BLUF domain-containing protein [Brevundimonas pishanensis]